MLIMDDPDEWESVATHHTCVWHQANPGKPWPGCTCSSGYIRRRRSPEEVTRIREEKRLRHEEAVLAEAAQIQARRSIGGV